MGDRDLDTRTCLVAVISGVAAEVASDGGAARVQTAVVVQVTEVGIGHARADLALHASVQHGGAADGGVRAGHARVTGLQQDHASKSMHTHHD